MPTLMVGCPQPRDPSSAKPDPEPMRLRPRFHEGDERRFAGHLQLSFRMDLWGSDHDVPIDLAASFELTRRVATASAQRVTLVDRFSKVEMKGEGQGVGRLKPVVAELEQLVIHWTLGAQGVASFEARHQGTLLRKLKLGQTLERLYELAARAPSRPVTPGARWKGQKTVRTSFSDVPFELEVTATYRYLGHERCDQGWCPTIQGEESAVIPDVQEGKTRHHFKLGGLVKGDVRVMLSSRGDSWRSWAVNRVFALAASKKNAQKKELTWGIRYEVDFRLGPFSKAADEGSEEDDEGEDGGGGRSN